MLLEKQMEEHCRIIYQFCWLLYLNWTLLLLPCSSVWTLLLICTTTMFLVLLGRAVFVFPLSALANFTNRSPAPSSLITFRHQVSLRVINFSCLMREMTGNVCYWAEEEIVFLQVVIWWAGLMRGAVSIALAFKQVFPWFLTAYIISVLVIISSACLSMQYTHSGVTWESVNATMVLTTIIVVLFSTMVIPCWNPCQIISYEHMFSFCHCII